MHSIIPIYNLNTIDSYSYIFFNSLKSLVRILLGIKCKLSMFIYLFIIFYYFLIFVIMEHFFFMIHLF